MYRVDRRIFKIKDIVTAPKETYQMQATFDTTIEIILSAQKPDHIQADRKNNLFIFIELADAIRFSCLMTDSKIYKVIPCSDTAVYFRGDMNWTEIMHRVSTNEDAMKLIANLYWEEGSKTFKPCWEALVNKMQIKSVVVPTPEQRNQICLALRSVDSNIELLPFYISNLNTQ